ncbi:MAG TPA: hypothetical protein VHN98_00085 [Acidimicrobiales bacterium]|nr:hypothetical protein [Acidimicrobiales bacterium]
MSLSDILDGAFKLLKANAKTILLIVATITLPLQLLSAFATRQTFDVGLMNVINDPTVAESVNRSSAARSIAQLAAVLLSLLVTPFIAGAVSRVVAASYVGDTISVGGALRVALRRSPALLAAFVLVHLAILVGGVFCILPGFAVSALFVLVAPAIAIEEIGPIRAMRRSWRLVWPRFWPVLGISLLAGFIANLFSQILGAIPVYAATIIGGSYAWIVAAVGATLGELVAAPIVVIVATLLYFDARIRREGFDLQVMAADIGAR